MVCKKCAAVGLAICFCGALYIEAVHRDFKEHIEEGTQHVFFTAQAPVTVISTASSVADHPFIFKNFILKPV